MTTPTLLGNSQAHGARHANPIPATVIVLTKNEEANLGKCIASAGDFAELFVVDSHSTDRTREIALERDAKIVDFHWDGRYPKKKQWALENLPASHGWVLYLDADEEITPDLAAEIRGLLEGKPRHSGYFVGLDYRFLGRTLRHGQRVHKLILFDRTCGGFEERDDLDAANMWEVEGHYQPRISGSIGRLRSPLVHDDHESLFHYFERHNRYSDWEATLRQKQDAGVHSTQETQLKAGAKSAFQALPFKSLAFFLYSYIWRRGFLDGRAGYHYALAKAFYYWQIRVKELELAERGR
jgi:glycosyltransferase involved in cell wall biosynthesis